MPIRPFLMLLAAALVSSPATSAAFELDCGTLREVVAGADDGFRTFAGKPIAHVTAGAMPVPDPATLARLQGEFSRESWEANRALGGAAACTVTHVHRADDEVSLRQEEYACRYPAQHALPLSLGEDLARCLDKPADPDADESSLAITMDVVESGEGNAVLLVGAEANLADGMRLVVSWARCEAREPGACDDDDDNGEVRHDRQSRE